jgi:hypothetical protein
MRLRENEAGEAAQTLVSETWNVSSAALFAASGENELQSRIPQTGKIERYLGF